jgi:3',5'-cyclic AMP phosphodiesterase CpdA
LWLTLNLLGILVKILHLSDLHFGPFHIKEKLNWINSYIDSNLSVEDSVIVISGDFTQRARKSQFRTAREFLDYHQDRFLIVTPGNHDIPLYRILERVFTPYTYYRRYIHNSLNYSKTFQSSSIGNVTFISLNSTAQYRRIDGHLTARQLSLLDCDNTDFKIVVTHHPVNITAQLERKETLFFNQQVLDKLIENNNLKLCLSGHIHVAQNTELVKSDNSKLINIIAGTGSSSRGRFSYKGLCSFNLIDITREKGSGFTIRVTNYTDKCESSNSGFTVEKEEAFQII